MRVLGGQLEATTTTGRGPAQVARRPPHLVLLHEGLGSVGLWRSFPQQLHDACAGAEVFAYSRHGYGASAPPVLPRPVTYMHHEADAVLPQVLHELGIQAPILIGHSDGASIALLNAGSQQQPAQPAALVLIAPHVFVEDITVAAIEAARISYSSGDLRTRLAKHHVDVDAAFNGWNDVWLSPEFRTWNIEDRLSNIVCPVLLIQGSADPYGTLKQLDAIEAGIKTPSINVTRLIIDGCGHAPHLERPETVVAAIASFIGELGQCSRSM